MPDSNQKAVDYYDQTFFEYFIVLGLWQHWGLHYGYYDDDNRSYALANINMNRVLSQKAGIREGMRVLDAGCGVGGSSVWLAKHTGAEVVGITLSAKQCARAKWLAKNQKVVDKTEFYVADYRKTNFSANSFDVVWAIESVSTSEDKLPFLREAYRLLKKGGKLILSDGFLIDRRLTDSEQKEIDTWIHTWVVSVLTPVASFKKQMQEAGFTAISGEDVTAHVLPFSRWLYLRTKYFFLPIARVLRFMGILNEVQVDNGVGALGQYETLKKGLWCYVIVKGKK